jgi:hypothetical protein
MGDGGAFFQGSLEKMKGRKKTAAPLDAVAVQTAFDRIPGSRGRPEISFWVSARIGQGSGSKTINRAPIF